MPTGTFDLTRRRSEGWNIYEVLVEEPAGDQEKGNLSVLCIDQLLLLVLALLPELAIALVRHYRMGTAGE